MSTPTIEDSVVDLRLNLNRLEGIVEEVERHIAGGKLDTAAAVLGSQDGKIARFQGSYEGLYEKLHNEGADPRLGFSAEPV